MPEVLLLREHHELPVRFPPVVLEALQRDYADVLDVWLTPSSGWRIKAKAHVGTLVVPGLELRIRPKCGTRNLFAMLAYAYDLTRLRSDTVEQLEIEDIREFLIAILAAHLEDLVRGGLRRGYIEYEDNLAVMRGRLVLDRVLRRGPSTDVSLPCRFEEYTSDLPLNQVIRYTLTRIGSLGEKALDHRLRRLRAAFSTVSPRSFRLSDFEKFHYDRLIAHYQPIHALCRLILEALGAEDEAGSRPMGSFLVDMNRLFERFVSAWLGSRLRPPWALRTQTSQYLDLTRKIRLQPDLTLARAGSVRLIADTKYKLAKGNPSNQDVYQLLAYCRALRTRRAVLLYPDLDTPQPHLTIRDHKNEIHIDGIPLHHPWPTIETHLTHLLDRLIYMAEPEGDIGRDRSYRKGGI